MTLKIANDDLIDKINENCPILFFRFTVMYVNVFENIFLF